jgi:hypothetical protein
MKRTRDPLYRCAERVRHHLALLARARIGRRDQRLGHLAESCQALARRHGLLERARRHGLPLAADRLRSRLHDDLYRVHQVAAELVQLKRDAAPPPPPSLEALLADLGELRSEFASAAFDAGEDQITIRTEPIVLDAVALGPFQIELHLARLAREPGSGCFRCVALEPNPAAGNSSVTHPHVSDGTLCAGDAFESIQLALSQGRVCDAFLLVAGVLRAYNPGSPYVSLEEWEGADCPECSAAVRRRDDLYHCEDCDRDVCDGCMGQCDVCDGSCCHACLERDPVSQRECCPNCRQTCSTCGRTVDTDRFDEPSQLCPECLADAEPEPPDPEPEETAHETDDPSPVPAAPGEVAAA